MTEITVNALQTLQNLFTLAFVVTSMLGMGLSLSVSQILQPLRNTRLVILSLVVNFVVVPATAFTLSRVIRDYAFSAGGRAVGQGPYQGVGHALEPVMAQISTVSLALLLVLMLALNFQNVLALFGTGAVAVTLLFVAVSVLAGYVLGGPSVKTKRVLALGTGQRNLSAAFIIATGNFGDEPDVLVYVAAAGLVGMVLLFPTAGEFGKRVAVTRSGWAHRRTTVGGRPWISALVTASWVAKTRLSVSPVGSRWWWATPATVARAMAGDGSRSSTVGAVSSTGSGGWLRCWPRNSTGCW
jgi:predicted Na+-dependent transporter